MSSAGGRPSGQTMASVRTSIVPPGPRPPPPDTPGTSPIATTSQATASLHDFAVSLGLGRLMRLRPHQQAAEVAPATAETHVAWPSASAAGLTLAARPPHAGPSGQAPMSDLP